MQLAGTDMRSDEYGTNHATISAVQILSDGLETPSDLFSSISLICRSELTDRVDSTQLLSHVKRDLVRVKTWLLILGTLGLLTQISL
jgi:hypothetical protein